MDDDSGYIDRIPTPEELTALRDKAVQGHTAHLLVTVRYVSLAMVGGAILLSAIGVPPETIGHLAGSLFTPMVYMLIGVVAGAFGYYIGAKPKANNPFGIN